MQSRVLLVRFELMLTSRNSILRWVEFFCERDIIVHFWFTGRISSQWLLSSNLSSVFWHCKVSYHFRKTRCCMINVIIFSFNESRNFIYIKFNLWHETFPLSFIRDLPYEKNHWPGTVILCDYCNSARNYYTRRITCSYCNTNTTVGKFL